MKLLLLAATAGATLTAAPRAGDGDMLPPSKLEVIDPLIDSLEELRGRVVLLEFFAEW